MKFAKYVSRWLHDWIFFFYIVESSPLSFDGFSYVYFHDTRLVILSAIVVKLVGRISVYTHTLHWSHAGEHSRPYICEKCILP